MSLTGQSPIVVPNKFFQADAPVATPIIMQPQRGAAEEVRSAYR